MKKLKEICRMKFELGYGHRVIGKSVNISPATVSYYVNLFKLSGLTWGEANTLDDEALRERVIPLSTTAQVPRYLPDFTKCHTELQRKGVTLLTLWEEYKSQHPEGLGYTQFTKRYKAYAKTLCPVMRFQHKAGEKTFVDYAGLTMQWVNRKTGEIHKVQIFVGCLGASSLTYAEATASQKLPDWIGSHVRMFEYFGGVTSAVKKILEGKRRKVLERFFLLRSHYLFESIFYFLERKALMK